MSKPKVLLIGFGGVGTIVSYTLEHLGRAEVSAVSRPETHDSIVNGFRIESIDYGIVENYVPTNVYVTAKEAYKQQGPFDYIIITTKNIPDIAPVVDMIDGWRKLVYNACINTTCALANLDAGRVQIFGGFETLVKPAMLEVIAVAKSEGVELPAKEVMDTMCNMGKDVYYPPSMLIDVRNGTYLEHIVIIGNVVKYGSRNGVPIPTLTVLNNLLKLVQMRTMEANKRFNFKPTHVYKDVKEAYNEQGPFDYIVITTKNIPDVNPVEKMIEGAYSKDTPIVLLENGIGIERSMFRAYPDATVISGVTMISSTLFHGKIVKHVGVDSVSFGPFINPNLDRDLQIAKAKKFAKLYYNQHNGAKYDEDVKFIRWKKLVYNAAINTTCAITNVDCGRLELFGGMDKIVRPAMKEVIAIAKADGVTLPEGIDEAMIRSDDGEYYPPSMLIDVRKNQYTEYKTILGTALETAQDLGVEAPVLSLLCSLLEVIQYRTMESHGRILTQLERQTRHRLRKNKRASLSSSYSTDTVTTTGRLLDKLKLTEEEWEQADAIDEHSGGYDYEYDNDYDCAYDGNSNTDESDYDSSRFSFDPDQTSVTVIIHKTPKKGTPPDTFHHLKSVLGSTKRKNIEKSAVNKALELGKKINTVEHNASRVVYNRSDVKSIHMDTLIHDAQSSIVSLSESDESDGNNYDDGGDGEDDLVNLYTQESLEDLSMNLRKVETAHQHKRFNNSIHTLKSEDSPFTPTTPTRSMVESTPLNSPLKNYSTPQYSITRTPNDNYFHKHSDSNNSIDMVNALDYYQTNGFHSVALDSTRNISHGHTKSAIVNYNQVLIQENDVKIEPELIRSASAPIQRKPSIKQSPAPEKPLPALPVHTHNNNYYTRREGHKEPHHYYPHYYSPQLHQIQQYKNPPYTLIHPQTHPQTHPTSQSHQYGTPHSRYHYNRTLPHPIYSSTTTRQVPYPTPTNQPITNSPSTQMRFPPSTTYPRPRKHKTLQSLSGEALPNHSLPQQPVQRSQQPQAYTGHHYMNHPPQYYSGNRYPPNARYQFPSHPSPKINNANLYEPPSSPSEKRNNTFQNVDLSYIIPR
ncbi:putative 2-dehydropantoate 2-reductase [Pichia kudriavzevii]|uniref:Putative 2-dehydropantoate 2-reductase n=1 Tax=Pichia kudriavzevii TaxID=4909 RepID=A0A1V2LVP1_PICKU|nr:putative 2-dehydropantoate 2-reductase [Pichia kudriavzevii]